MPAGLGSLRRVRVDDRSDLRGEDAHSEAFAADEAARIVRASDSLADIGGRRLPALIRQLGVGFADVAGMLGGDEAVAVWREYIASHLLLESHVGVDQVHVVRARQAVAEDVVAIEEARRRLAVLLGVVVAEDARPA